MVRIQTGVHGLSSCFTIKPYKEDVEDVERDRMYTCIMIGLSIILSNLNPHSSGIPSKLFAF